MNRLFKILGNISGIFSPFILLPIGSSMVIGASGAASENNLQLGIKLPELGSKPKVTDTYSPQKKDPYLGFKPDTNPTRNVLDGRITQSQMPATNQYLEQHQNLIPSNNSISGQPSAYSPFMMPR